MSIISYIQSSCWLLPYSAMLVSAMMIILTILSLNDDNCPDSDKGTLRALMGINIAIFVLALLCEVLKTPFLGLALISPRIALIPFLLNALCVVGVILSVVLINKGKECDLGGKAEAMLGISITSLVVSILSTHKWQKMLPMIEHSLKKHDAKSDLNLHLNKWDNNVNEAACEHLQHKARERAASAARLAPYFDYEQVPLREFIRSRYERYKKGKSA